MSDVEERLRLGLADPAWDGTPWADPVGRLRQRVARDRRRRAVAAPIAVAVTLAAVAGGTALLREGTSASTTGTVAGSAPLNVSVERDGLTMTLRLDDGTPAVGQRVVGRLSLANGRDEAVQVRSGCGRQPSFNVDYRSFLQSRVKGDDQGPVTRFSGAVLGDLPTSSSLLFGGAPRYFQVPAPGGVCPEDQADVPVAPGGVLDREIAWTVEVPGGVATESTLPITAVISYVLPAGPDGVVPQGDSTSRGSTTPTARNLTLDTGVPVHGGDSGRAAVPDVVGAALADDRFRSVLARVPTDRWRYAWVLPADKPTEHGGFSFGSRDTDPAFGKVDTWYVALVYSSGNGSATRATATVDGATGRVIDVLERPEP